MHVGGTTDRRFTRRMFISANEWRILKPGYCSDTCRNTSHAYDLTTVVGITVSWTLLYKRVSYRGSPNYSYYKKADFKKYKKIHYNITYNICTIFCVVLYTIFSIKQ